MNSRCRIVPLLLLLVCSLTAQAERDLRVATKESPPFVTRAEDGSWTGLSVELWQLIAKRIGARTEFVERDLETMLDETATGQVDLALAAITVTAERESRMEFSHPFLSSGLGIATRGEEAGMLAALTSRLFSLELLQALLALALVLAVCGTLIWLLERRANPDQFGGAGLRGLGAGFWFSAVTMTTVGYGDKAPATFGGRALALIWMFASVIIISSYTASIASALTVERLNAVVRSADDLAHSRVGTVRGSAAAGWLDERGVAHEGRARLADAVEALRAGRLDAVVYDAPMLKSLTRTDDDLIVLPEVLRVEQYAIALPPNSALRKDINMALIEVLNSDQWTALRERYLGK